MQLRIARHTKDRRRIAEFYTEVIGLEILGEFQDHEGYDGIMLGHKSASWHLEFTTSDCPPDHKPDEDDLLVFYVESQAELDLIQQRLDKKGISKTSSKNPYWNRNGLSFADPDGFLVVISFKHN